MNHSFYNQSTGHFSSQQVFCPEDQLAANTPEGFTAIEGDYDYLSKKVNLTTLEVEEWVPPAPADTELETWSWDTEILRWVGSPTLQAKKLAKWEQVKAARNLAIDAPKTTSVGTFDAKAEDQNNLSKVINLLKIADSLGLPTTTRFTLSDNTRPEFTLAQLELAALEMGSIVQSMHNAGDTLRSAIAAVTDEEALAGIVWAHP